MTDLRKLLKRMSICFGFTSMKFQGPIARFTGSSIVSLPMPCDPPSTSAWLIFSWGRCTRWASHLMMCSASSPEIHRTRPRLDVRRPVKVENCAARSVDPSALGNQPVFDFHRITWGPGHLFDRTVLREPLTGGYQIAC